MKVIYKYRIYSDVKISEISIQRGALILHAAMQDGYPQIWALVNPEAEMVYRKFATIPTGLIFPDTEGMTYINTLQEGRLIWHIFDGGEVK